METRVIHRPAAELRADLLAVPLGAVDPKRRKVPSRLDALDRALGGRIDEGIRSGDFKGKRGETLLLFTGPGASAARVLLVGLGDEAQLDAQVAREAGAIAIAQAGLRGAREVALVAPPSRRLRAPALVQALAEGATLAAYRFDKYRSAGEEARKKVEG